jgi:hypothetical protein
MSIFRQTTFMIFAGQEQLTLLKSPRQNEKNASTSRKKSSMQNLYTKSKPHFNRGINMSFQMFSQDGLDTLYWGFILLLAGSLTSILALVNGAFLILGAIISIIGWVICIMGVSALRRDYRARVQRREPSPPPPPPSGTAPTCPTCGGALTFVQQYQRWYCPVDQKYV